MAEEPQSEMRLDVDDDWKAEAQREKDELEREAAEAGPGGPLPAPGQHVVQQHLQTVAGLLDLARIGDVEIEDTARHFGIIAIIAPRGGHDDQLAVSCHGLRSACRARVDATAERRDAEEGAH